MSSAKEVLQSIPCRVKEIFTTLQGEGYWTGTVSVFVRMSGCNLKCSFCDTNHSQGRLINSIILARSILREISRLRLNGKNQKPLIVWTGGEPLLQQDAMALAFRILNKKGYIQAVETNGTIRPTLRFDWITVSPKPDQCEPVVFAGDELKLLYRPDAYDIEDVWRRTAFSHYFLQPLSGICNAEPVINYIKKHPHWRLSIQCQKILKIP